MSDILRVRKSWNQNNLLTEGEKFHEVNNVMYYIEKKAFFVRFTSNNKIFSISRRKCAIANNFHSFIFHNID